MSVFLRHSVFLQLPTHTDGMDQFKGWESLKLCEGAVNQLPRWANFGKQMFFLGYGSRLAYEYDFSDMARNAMEAYGTSPNCR